MTVKEGLLTPPAAREVSFETESPDASGVVATAITVGVRALVGRAVVADGDGILVGGIGVLVGVVVPTIGIPSVPSLTSVKLAEIQPRSFGFVGSRICHQSLARVRPMICALSPFSNWPTTDARVAGAARICRSSLAVANIWTCSEGVTVDVESAASVTVGTVVDRACPAVGAVVGSVTGGGGGGVRTRVGTVWPAGDWSGLAHTAPFFQIPKMTSPTNTHTKKGLFRKGIIVIPLLVQAVA
jgi:hypothetical protein